MRRWENLVGALKVARGSTRTLLGFAVLVALVASFLGCGGDDPVGPSGTVDISVTKTVNDNAPTEGDTVVYTIVIANAGPDPASGIEITDNLPPGITFISSSVTRGSFDAGTGIWDLGNIASGNAETLTITVSLDDGMGPRMLTNRATLTGVDQTDSDSANDTDVANLTVGDRVLVLEPIKDNTLYEDANGELSNGVGEFMFAGRTMAGVRRRCLMAFDFSALPANAVIESVELTLNMTMTARPDSFNCIIHRVLADSGEGTSNAGGRTPGDGGGGGAQSTTGDATWLHRFYNGSFWNNPGGDFNAFAAATVAVGAVGSYTWSGNGLRADVEFWLQNPNQNFGWMLRGNETTNQTAKRFDTRENVDGTGPVLRITYALP